MDLEINVVADPALDVTLPAGEELSLQAKQQRILSLRDRIASAYSELFTCVEDLQSRTDRPAEEITDFLRRECGLTDREIRVLQKFPTVLKAHQSILRSRRVPFETIHALAQTDKITREHAIKQLEMGADLQARDVSAIRRNRRRVQMTPASRFKGMRRKIMRDAVADHGQRLQSRLEDECRSLYRMMAAFEAGIRYRATNDDFGRELQNRNFEDEALGSLTSSINKSASRALHIFSQLFEVAVPPKEEWAANFFADPGKQCLVEAKYALEYLESRPFFRHRFPEESSDYYWWSVSEAVGYLAGKVYKTPDASGHMRQLQAVELCAGAGGQAIGLAAARFEIVKLYETSDNCLDTLNTNMPGWSTTRKSLQNPDVLEELHALRGKVDLLAGGLPCQPVSRAGKRRGKADRRQLFTASQDLVRALEPEAFFFETVDGFFDEKFTDWRDEITASYAASGYTIDYIPLNARDFGLGQERSRVVIAGVKRGYCRSLRSFTIMPDEKGIGEVAVDILFPHRSPGAGVDMPSDELSAQQKLYDAWAAKWLARFGKKFAPSVVRWTEEMKTSEGWRALNIDPSVLRETAVPLEAAIDEDMTVPLSIELLKRLQGLPAKWALKGSLRAQASQIGNVFPPVMARAVAHYLRNIIAGQDPALDLNPKTALIDERTIGHKPGKLRLGLSMAKDPYVYVGSEWRAYVARRNHEDQLDREYDGDRS